MTIEASLERIAGALETLVGRATIPLAPAQIAQLSDLQAANDATFPAVAPVTTSAQLPVQAPPSPGRGRGRPAKPSQTSTPAASAAPTPPALAPAAEASGPAAGAGSTPTVTLQQTTDIILALANEHSREEAIAILKARRGVTRCSELKPDELPGVYADAKAAYDRHESLKQTSAGGSLI